MRIERIHSGPAVAQSDLLQAPPSFSVDGESAVFVDLCSAHGSFDFNVATQTATAVATLTFDLAEAGFPVLDLVPQATGVKIDGRSVPIERYAEVVPPGEEAPLRILKERLSAGRHTVEVSYVPSEVYFRDGGVGFRFRMSDMEPRLYLEKYLPSSLEYDQFALTIDVAVHGALHPHRLLANGRVESRGESYHVEFPSYFTTSSPYVDLFNPAEYRVVEDSYEGKTQRIPLTMYAPTVERANDGMAIAKRTLAELEETYGAYGHGLFLALIGGEWAGGMEHAGAARTSLSALPHEMMHSYFARGVMPANGDAGWVDEAIARWRDRGYPRATAIDLTGPVEQLAGFSPYRRHSLRAAYEQGSAIMSELDWMLRDGGGLRPVLADFYARYAHQTITTPLFLDFVQARVGSDLSAYFGRKVYGRSSPVRVA